eukprot:g2648.t1
MYVKTIDVGRRRDHTNEGKRLFLNVLDTESETASRSNSSNSRRTLVLAHGLGSGAGFFFHNFDDLAHSWDRVIAFDWLGFGASSRPVCREAPKLRNSGRGSWSFCESKLATTEDNINFFIDSTHDMIESIEMNVGDRITLCGHSLGGYLSAMYALKYPSRVESLLLLSPAGLSKLPSSKSTIPPSDLPTGMRLIDTAWASNVTPGQIVRALGPRGPRVVSKIVQRRFRSIGWDPQDAKLVSDYLYHITAAPGSGEFAMNSLLRPIIDSATGRPSVYARKPIEETILDFATTRGNDGSSSSSIDFPPTRVLFGDRDWLYEPGASERAVGAMRSSGIDISMGGLLENAGHHLYLDNAPGVHGFIDASV